MLRGGVVPPAPTAEEFQGPLVDCMDMFAYFGFEEQLKSCLELMAAHGLQVEKGTRLEGRMTLHSCLYALKTTVDSSQLELIIEQFDRKLGETTMRDKWLRLRPHFVGQVSLIGLRQRLGMSLEEDMVEDRHLKRISLQQWPDEVQALFGYFGYSQRPSELVVPDADARNETGFQTFVYQVHKLQDDLKSFASKGDSAKWALNSLLREHSWAAWIAQFSAFIREVHVQLYGVPKLVQQHRVVHVAQHAAPEPMVMEGGQSPLPAQAPVPAPPAPAAVRRQDRQLLPPAAGGLSDLTPPRAAPLRRRVDPAQQAGRAATTNSSSSSSSSTTTTTTVPEPVRAPVDNLRHASQSLAGVGEDPLDESLADTSPTATSHLKRPGPPVDAGPQLPGPTTAAPRPAATNDNFTGLPGQAHTRGAASLAASLTGPRPSATQERFDSQETDISEYPTTQPEPDELVRRPMPAVAAYDNDLTALEPWRALAAQGAATTVKKRQRWTEEEINSLRQGVECYGEGQWSMIRSSYPILQERNRSTVDIKDKWRNMKKAATPRTPSAQGTSTADNQNQHPNLNDGEQTDPDGGGGGGNDNSPSPKKRRSARLHNAN